MSDFLFYGQITCGLIIGVALVVKIWADNELKRIDREQRSKMVSDIEALKRRNG